MLTALPARHGARGGRHRRLVAVRPLDGRDARAARLRAAAAHVAGRVRDVRARRAGRRRAHVRRPRARRRALGAGGPTALGAAAVVAVAAAAARRAGCGSRRRSAARCRRRGGACCRCRSPPPATACCSASASRRSCSRSPSGRSPGASIALGDPALGLAIGLAFGAGRALPVVVLAPFAGSERGGAVTRRCASGRRSCSACAGSTRSRWPRARSRWSRERRPRARTAAVRRRRLRPDAGGGADRLAAANGQALLAARRLRRGGCPARIPALGGGRIAWREATRSWSPTRPRSPGSSVPAPGADVLARVGRAAGLAHARRRRHDRIWGRSAAGRARRVLPRRGAERARPARAARRPAALPRRRPARQPASSPSTRRRARGDRCAASAARCSPTRRPTAACCSTCTRPGRAQELRLGPLEPRAPRRRPASCVTRPSGRRDREHEPGRSATAQATGAAAAARRARAWSTRCGPPRWRRTPPTSRGCAARGAPRTADILRVATCPPGRRTGPERTSAGGDSHAQAHAARRCSPRCVVLAAPDGAPGGAVQAHAAARPRSDRRRRRDRRQRRHGRGDGRAASRRQRRRRRGRRGRRARRHRAVLVRHRRRRLHGHPHADAARSRRSTAARRRRRR